MSTEPHVTCLRQYRQCTVCMPVGLLPAGLLLGLHKNQFSCFCSCIAVSSPALSRSYTLYDSIYSPTDRYGVSYPNPRETYHNFSRDSTGNQTSLSGDFFGLKEQREYKYTLNLDGIGCSTRFQKLLATGQVGGMAGAPGDFGCSSAQALACSASV